ncbi:arabinan endo-1,5-alpha-L-arabinosidase [Streptomyces roseus]|uniref:arabinan endo-1,5-alpha-L-arabinosidase n=1 Tax=Streptomyces roseus TaxID=66430 RepID=UPI00380C2724
MAGDLGVHDPVLVTGIGGVPYTVFSTNTPIQMRQSSDGVHFAPVGSALPSAPNWWSSYTAGANNAWAPDVSFHNGQYWMYYAVSSFGSKNSAIGLATSLTGAPGTWADQGIVISSGLLSLYNAIDPNLLVDKDGKWWLIFGSFSTGLYMTPLNPATGKLATPLPQLTRIASRPVFPDPIEASFVYQHGGYYYLFVSFDYCCRGINSDYNIRVGRSTSPTGPYVDKNGIPLQQGGGTPVLETHDWVVGPGHSAVTFDPASGKDLLVYHYYDGRQNGTSRLGINCLEWDPDGWPRAV